MSGILDVGRLTCRRALVTYDQVSGSTNREEQS